MPLTPGTKLGQYEVVESIGAGGMGEVYRARDAKLGREVAVKILSADFAGDPERLARFDREARLLAQLNHPYIATLYGLDEADGQKLLVMELVEGETLGEMIAERALPVEEAVSLFILIAEGLEAAHERGIVHRDLKPANIKIGLDGKPKILDFGLAKAFVGDTELASDSSQSPTVTKGTALGAIMGTASYMSPEQARGKHVDRRTDNFAFGACLYEALTGMRAFEGETVTDILAAVVNNEPDWRRLPQRLSLGLRKLLERCLRKDKTKRLQHIGDARVALEEAREQPVSSEKPERRGAEILAAALAGGLVVGAAAWLATGDGRDRAPTYLSVTLPPNVQLHVGPGPVGVPFALSPDGSSIVFSGNQSGQDRLYFRSLREREAVPIRGTERARRPIFSPDGKWIAFSADGKLKKVPPSGGPPIALGASVGRAADWSTRGVIIRADFDGLFEVPADGGEARRLTTVDVDRNEMSHDGPQVLPGGDAVLMSIQLSTGQTEIAVTSLDTGAKRVLVEEGGRARYATTGHIVFVRDASLMAIPFDVETLEVRGSPVPVLDGLTPYGGGFFDLTNDGTLAYVPELSGTPLAGTIVRVNRRGVAESTGVAPRRYYYPRLSPDERQVALHVLGGDGPEVWLLELERGISAPFTFEGDANARPVWSPDGTRLYFGSNRLERRSYDVFVKAIDGSTGALPLSTEISLTPTSITSDGSTLVVRKQSEDTGSDIGFLALDENNQLTMLLETPFNEHSGALSPDDEWLAYVSDESGRDEVYVRPFRESGARVRVSTEGGTEPVWSRDGGELFYRRGAQMISVSVALDPELAVGARTVLFEAPQYQLGGPIMPPLSWRQNYDVTRDGEHFIMVESDDTAGHTFIDVVLDWSEELERLVPAND